MSREDELMARARDGEKEAFEVLAAACRPRLESFCHRMLGDAEVARDAAQETLVRLWERAHLYEPRGSFAAFLFTIARNVCLRHGERRRETVPLEDCAAVVLSAMPDHGLLCRVREAFLALPQEQRLVLILSEFDGLRYDEIGQILGCPPGTVGSRKHAAVRAVRKMLHEE